MGRGKNEWIHEFLECISMQWNASILAQDLSSCCQIHFLQYIYTLEYNTIVTAFRSKSNFICSLITFLSLVKVRNENKEIQVIKNKEYRLKKYFIGSKINYRQDVNYKFSWIIEVIFSFFRRLYYKIMTPMSNWNSSFGSLSKQGNFSIITLSSKILDCFKCIWFLVKRIFKNRFCNALRELGLHVVFTRKIPREI